MADFYDFDPASLPAAWAIEQERRSQVELSREALLTTIGRVVAELEWFAAQLRGGAR